jgi:hypothetical protein
VGVGVGSEAYSFCHSVMAQVLFAGLVLFPVYTGFRENLSHVNMRVRITYMYMCRWLVVLYFGSMNFKFPPIIELMTYMKGPTDFVLALANCRDGREGSKLVH